METGHWDKLPDLNVARERHFSTTLGSKVFIAAGFGDPEFKVRSESEILELSCSYEDSISDYYDEVSILNDNSNLVSQQSNSCNLKI